MGYAASKSLVLGIPMGVALLLSFYGGDRVDYNRVPASVQALSHAASALGIWVGADASAVVERGLELAAAFGFGG